jgi:hypothetical protein
MVKEEFIKRESKKLAVADPSMPTNNSNNPNNYHFTPRY